MWVIGKLKPIERPDYFNDRQEWHLPSDYEYVVVKDGDDNEVEMEEMNGVQGSHIRALKSCTCKHALTCRSVTILTSIIRKTAKVVPAEEGTHPKYSRTGTTIVKDKNNKVAKKASDSEDD